LLTFFYTFFYIFNKNISFRFGYLHGLRKQKKRSVLSIRKSEFFVKNTVRKSEFFCNFFTQLRAGVRMVFYVNTTHIIKNIYYCILGEFDKISVFLYQNVDIAII